MSVVYVPAADDGLDRLFDYGLARLRNKQALAQLKQQHEYDLDTKRFGYDREDEVSKRNAQVLRSALDGNASSGPSVAPPPPISGAPMTNEAFGGGLESLLQRSPVSENTSVLDMLRRISAADGDPTVAKSIIDLYSNATGVDRMRAAQDAFRDFGLENGYGLGSFASHINPGGISFSPADQTELGNKSAIAKLSAETQKYVSDNSVKGARISAGPAYAGVALGKDELAQRRNEWDNGKKDLAQAEAAQYKSLVDAKKRELEALANAVPAPTVESIARASGGKITAEQFSNTQEGRAFMAQAKANGVLSALARGGDKSTWGDMIQDYLAPYGITLVTPASSDRPSVFQPPTEQEMAIFRSVFGGGSVDARP